MTFEMVLMIAGCLLVIFGLFFVLDEKARAEMTVTGIVAGAVGFILIAISAYLENTPKFG